MKLVLKYASTPSGSTIVGAQELDNELHLQHEVEKNSLWRQCFSVSKIRIIIPFSKLIIPFGNFDRFRYSDLKQLLLKAYILTRFWVFLFIFGDHMLKI